MNKERLIAFIGLAFLVLVAFGLRNRNAGRPEIGTAAPNLELEFFDGYEWDTHQTANLNDISSQGNVVVLNFWASWCVPCRVEADALEATWRDYADDGVVFVGVAWSDTDTKAHEYMQEFSISYPNAPDLGLNAQRTYKFPQVPETYVIGRDGTITHFHFGSLTQPQLSSMIDEALRQ